MIGDIINAIKGRVKFCLQVNGNSYFIDSLSDDLKFIDVVDGKEFQLRNIESSTITTFSSGTIPVQKEIEEIRANDYSFFEKNKDAINQSNAAFDSFAQQAKDYLSIFTNNSENIVKSLMLQYRTKDLEILKILKSDRAFLFGGKGNTSIEDSTYVRGLFFKLVELKLKEAVNEIDINIEEINDDEFTEEANQIKQDLQNNVTEFKINMRGTEYRKLFNQWPTLLNPSPFANVDPV